MSSLTVKFELPRELLSVLDVPEDKLNAHVLQLVILELIREQRISFGKGAELLGLSQLEILPLLAQHGIPYFSISSNELIPEVKAGIDWLEKPSGS